MRVLVTGVAGFIGSAVAERLLSRGDEVLGIDNLNGYYDVVLKRARLARLERQRTFVFQQVDVSETSSLSRLESRNAIDAMVHFAAQAGVRHSIEHPEDYVTSNLVGFANVLELARSLGVAHFVFASSSSVYGANRKLPFSERDGVDHPLSFYAATKKANELIAHSYANLYSIPCSGLRFFTAYGPWGRPDMALFKFTERILAGQPIDVFNHGEMVRDFTYIDDVVEAVVRVIDRPAVPDKTWSGGHPDPSTSWVPYRIYNVGNNRPVELMRYIRVLERCLGRPAELSLLPLQKGDVPESFSDATLLDAAIGFHPNTTVEVGVARFVEWYRGYYGV